MCGDVIGRSASSPHDGGGHVAAAVVEVAEVVAEVAVVVARAVVAVAVAEEGEVEDMPATGALSTRRTWLGLGC